MIFQDFCFFSCSRFESTIEKDFFPFFFFSFFSPRQRKTRRTARVNSSVVVQQAFNQRAWKILFTRSRTPHRSPLSSLSASLHLHTRLHYIPDQRFAIGSSISSDASSFFFLPFSSLIRLKFRIFAHLIDSRTEQTSIKIIDSIVDRKTCFETRGFSNEARKKVSFQLIRECFFYYK